MAGVARDWYRSPDWDEPAQQDFEARLARARPHSRQEYLRIKALVLLEAGERQAAGYLLHRATEGVKDYWQSERVYAWELLGDMAAQDGDLDAAESLYRQVLAEPSDSGTSGCVAISLASLLAHRGDRAQLQEALELLAAWNDGEPAFMPSQAFRWQVALAEVAVAYGDLKTAREAAQAALELAGMGPVWPRKPTVGVVDAEASTVTWLQNLS